MLNVQTDLSNTLGDGRINSLANILTGQVPYKTTTRFFESSLGQIDTSFTVPLVKRFLHLSS